MFPVICLLFLSNQDLPNLLYLVDFIRLGHTEDSIRYSLSNIIRNPVVKLPEKGNKKVESFIYSNILMYIENSEKIPDKYGSLNTSNVTGNSTIYFKLPEYKTEILLIFYRSALLEMEVYPSGNLEKTDQLSVFATMSVQNNSINCKILFRKEEFQWYKTEKSKIMNILKTEEFSDVSNIVKTKSWYARVKDWDLHRFIASKEYVISLGFLIGSTSLLYIAQIARWVKHRVFSQQKECSRN